MNTRLISTIRAPFLSRKGPLSSFKKPLRLNKILGILYRITQRIKKKVFYTHIYTYLMNSLRIFLAWDILTRKGNKPHTCRCPSYGYSLNSPFNRSGEVEFKDTNTSDMQISTIKRPSCLFESKGVISISSLETGKTDFAIISLNSLKESLKGLISPLLKQGALRRFLVSEPKEIKQMRYV